GRRPGHGGAAPHPARRRAPAAGPAAPRRPRTRRDDVLGAPRGPLGRADPHPVLAAALPGAQQRPDRAQGATAAARLAVRARPRRVDRGRDLHQLPAAQAGRAGPAGHHHPARGRVRPDMRLRIPRPRCARGVHSLRGRLTLANVALLAVGVVAATVVSVMGMRYYLLDQIDAELTANRDRLGGSRLTLREIDSLSV